MTRNIIIASAMLALSAPAFAAPVDSQAVHVSTSDLDLNSPAGRDRLKARVGRAANKVCGANDARGVQAYRAFSNCRAAALQEALGQ